MLFDGLLQPGDSFVVLPPAGWNRNSRRPGGVLDHDDGRLPSVEAMTNASATIWLWAALLVTGVMGCGDGGTSPTAPSTRATVAFDYRASTSVNPDLPPSTQMCVNGVGRTHIHPSWRNFNRVDMQAVGSALWQITFTDVPIDSRLSIRVSDPNVCTENATGAATRNVFANDVRLVEVVPTPGTGTEPGLAFTVSTSGRVTP